MKNKIKIISFIVSFIYVFLGTITAMVAFPKYEIFGFDHNHPLWIPLSFITYPATFLLLGLFVVDNSISSIVILQSVVLIFFWFILYKIMKK